jgi:hypothetical protein
VGHFSPLRAKDNKFMRRIPTLSFNLLMRCFYFFSFLIMSLQMSNTPKK